MKQLLILFLITISARSFFGQAPKNCKPDVTINNAYSKAMALDSILKHFTTNMLPGASVAVYSEAEGWWVGAHGYAELEKRLPMTICHLQYLQSVSKSYMAVEILQLKEQGKIDLDAPMTKYLPAKYSRYIKDANSVTVRMLLNHTSGVPEYNEAPGFVSNVILHPLQNFSSEDCLKAINGMGFQFTPGSKYKYTNTNYLLLSLIGDAITGDHAAYIKKNIFKPLGLNNSYYGKDLNYLKGLSLPQSYWDVFNNGIAVNATPFQQMTVVCSKGDDGIVCTTTDAVKYLKGLMEGKLLNEGSMKELMEFVKDEKGNKRYSMGMIYFDLGGLPAYGHGGGGIGAGCGLLYIPSYKVYVFMATNIGCFIDSKLSAKAGEMRDAILMALLQ
ncbi:MAG TPA: serine hydrolase domain-containing protein [Chitinophagaceae bacterium]|nr:serine hydrolase domain-containing protein [Chitinophagaceae bacterium]